MAEPTSPLLYEEEYSIQKRADGTEDFHCIISSCAGVFSYRTLRALNNHRFSSHSLPDIPKRKRGPKKCESSRIRCRSADAIKRQVMKRAIDISKREQGCRSMARLRASRLAMAQAGGMVNNNDQVIQVVDKSLENWESGSSRRRSLLERRIQMARLEWAMKGEALPLLTSETATPNVYAKDKRLCFHADGSDNSETSEGSEVPGMLVQGTVEEAKESSATENPQQETCNSEQIEPNADDFAGTSVVHAAEMDGINGNFHDIEVHMNGEKRFVKNLLCNDTYEVKHVWHNHSVKKFVTVSHHEMKLPNKTTLAQQVNGIVPCFDRDTVHIEYGDSGLF